MPPLCPPPALLVLGCEVTRPTPTPTRGPPANSQLPKAPASGVHGCQRFPTTPGGGGGLYADSPRSLLEIGSELPDWRRQGRSKENLLVKKWVFTPCVSTQKRTQ